MARIDGLRDRGHFMQARTMYDHLNRAGLMSAVSRLADAGGKCFVNGVPIFVMSLDVAREAAREVRQPFVHRVFARCDCDRFIPFGKLGQHRKACTTSIEGE